MKSFKVFIITFLSAFAVMCVGFAGVYLSISYSSKDAGTNQENVPVINVQPDDFKTALICLEGDKTDLFFLLNLNAIQEKTSFIVLPSDLYLEKSQKTLQENMDYAGILQCVQSVSEEYAIDIHYYLSCDGENLSDILYSFSDIQYSDVEGFMPQSAANLIFNQKSSLDISSFISAVSANMQYLDNPLGHSFLANIGSLIIQQNMQAIYEDVFDSIKENFTAVQTNISTQDIDKLKRILTFLNTKCDFYFAAVTEENAYSEIDRLIKQ